jgi:uncharacterized phage protein (TIGR01671 family)
VNREIKFRAWDNELDCMNTDIQKETVLGEWLEEKERFTVMQYTGLKDKNGVEIYEGDILEHAYGIKARVVFVVEHAAFLAHYIINDNAEYDYLEESRMKDVEVIGNIYENPELLEGETK